jgi:hypothetical protein
VKRSTTGLWVPGQWSLDQSRVFYRIDIETRSTNCTHADGPLSIALSSHTEAKDISRSITNSILIVVRVDALGGGNGLPDRLAKS